MFSLLHSIADKNCARNTHLENFVINVTSGNHICYVVHAKRNLLGWVIMKKSNLSSSWVTWVMLNWRHQSVTQSEENKNAIATLWKHFRRYFWASFLMLLRCYVWIYCEANFGVISLKENSILSWSMIWTISYYLYISRQEEAQLGIKELKSWETREQLKSCDTREFGFWGDIFWLKTPNLHDP